MAKQSKSSESAETKVEETPVVEGAAQTVEEEIKSSEAEVLTGQDSVEAVREDGQDRQKSSEDSEELETGNEEYPYTLSLVVPTVIYRGPHKSLGEKRFCGVVTVLTAPDENGFVQVGFVRPGVGLAKGYIIR